MRSIAVISGKGGTGKTMVTAALADINAHAQVLADCDVDAANLELLLDAHIISTTDFSGKEVAVLNPDACISCGRCSELCRFEAIKDEEGILKVDPLRCEGCGVCVRFCPSGALSMQRVKNGELYVSDTDLGKLVHARLSPGSGNSGLLVHDVRRTASERGDNTHMLIDGPPGTGCPLISTVSGVDAVLMVTEPSISAIHDLERLVGVCRRFGPRMMTLINRYDLQTDLTDNILSFCRKEDIAVVGMIPFDPEVVRSVRSGIPVTRTDCEASKAFLRVWHDINKELDGHGR